MRINVYEANTVIGAVEHLEEYLCADFGAGDWNEKFLHTHFAICKKNIQRILREQGKEKFDKGRVVRKTI